MKYLSQVQQEGIEKGWPIIRWAANFAKYQTIRIQLDPGSKPLDQESGIELLQQLDAALEAKAGLFASIWPHGVILGVAPREGGWAVAVRSVAFLVRGEDYGWIPACMNCKFGSACEFAYSGMMSYQCFDGVTKPQYKSHPIKSMKGLAEITASGKMPERVLITELNVDYRTTAVSDIVFTEDSERRKRNQEAKERRRIVSLAKKWIQQLYPAENAHESLRKAVMEELARDVVAWPVAYAQCKMTCWRGRTYWVNTFRINRHDYAIGGGSATDVIADMLIASVGKGQFRAAKGLKPSTSSYPTLITSVAPREYLKTCLLRPVLEKIRPSEDDLASVIQQALGYSPTYARELAQETLKAIQGGEDE